jgi:hypothetical protein
MSCAAIATKPASCSSQKPIEKMAAQRLRRCGISRTVRVQPCASTFHLSLARASRDSQVRREKACDGARKPALIACIGRPKQGETYTSSGICNGLQIAGFPRGAGWRERGKFLPQHCAALSMLRASPGRTFLYARQTHAFDPGTDLQRREKQVTIHPHRCNLSSIFFHQVRSGGCCSSTLLYASATCCIMPSRASRRARVARR